MSFVTIDAVVEQIRPKLNLTAEAEWEVLEEIRAHLEDAVDAARSRGEDETVALLKAAEEFGLEESSIALQEVHGIGEMTEAILMCAVPIFCTVVLRWLVFAADGTAGEWEQIFHRPGVLVIGVIALGVPILQFKQKPYVIAGWVLFWMLSVVFMAFPTMRIW